MPLPAVVNNTSVEPLPSDRHDEPASPPPDGPNRVTAALRRISDATAFQATSIGVIVFNAVLIGAETYQGLLQNYGREFAVLDTLCLAFFIVELVIKLGGFGYRPWRFFANGWNVFDFVVVAGALLPGLRENITLLRLLRLARVVRIIRSFPQLRILLIAVWRSLPGALGLIGIAAVLLYLYGMIGWILFGEALPEQYGSIGDAMLSLFMLMTMDNVGMTVRAGMEVTDWAVPYYLSFVTIGGLVLINLLIGVVITSMEEARGIDRAENPDTSSPQPEPAAGDTAQILARLDALQRTVDALRRDRDGEGGKPEHD